jgi:hypothetical protein
MKRTRLFGTFLFLAGVLLLVSGPAQAGTFDLSVTPIGGTGAAGNWHATLESSDGLNWNVKISPGNPNANGLGLQVIAYFKDENGDIIDPVSHSNATITGPAPSGGKSYNGTWSGFQNGVGVAWARTSSSDPYLHNTSGMLSADVTLGHRARSVGIKIIDGAGGGTPIKEWESQRMVPEPSGLLLAASGVLPVGLVLFRNRRRVRDPATEPDPVDTS